MELIWNYSKVIGYKVNTQKLITFLYTSNDQVESEIKNTVLFTLATPKKDEMPRYKLPIISI